ncbi:hypothetical protein MNBD_BACTEROID07-1676 [hydrothermal vent metagenome]|uniref:Uncharacterized protein n=1 Tax=hydrothermal vent metagenome TaxID=652676 RepID=A0A3B0URC1_9ZZZZ
MVKKKTKTKKPVTLFGRRFSRSTLLIGAVILAIVGFAVYTAVANELDRRKFVQIEQTVLELTDRINAEFGTETLSIDKSCSRPREKYGKGALGCSITSESAQKYIEYNDLLRFIQSQADVVSTVSSEDELFRSIRFVPFVAGVGCWVENDLGYSASPSERATSTDKYLTTVGCGDLAKTAHYPISE